jgi:hypothetical protein
MSKKRKMSGPTVKFTSALLLALNNFQETLDEDDEDGLIAVSEEFRTKLEAIRTNHIYELITDAQQDVSSSKIDSIMLHEVKI